MADEYGDELQVGTHIPVPSYERWGDYYTDDELLSSTVGFTQRGGVIGPGQVLLLGTPMGRKASDGRWYASKSNDGGAEVTRGFLRTGIDTRVRPNGGERQGNIVTAGKLKWDRIVAAYLANEGVPAKASVVSVELLTDTEIVVQFSEAVRYSEGALIDPTDPSMGRHPIGQGGWTVAGAGAIGAAGSVPVEVQGPDVIITGTGFTAASKVAYTVPTAAGAPVLQYVSGDDVADSETLTVGYSAFTNPDFDKVSFVAEVKGRIDTVLNEFTF